SVTAAQKYRRSIEHLQVCGSSSVAVRLFINDGKSGSLVTDQPSAPFSRGFHERATTVKYFLVQRRIKTASPTNGRRHSVLPSSILRKVFAALADSPCFHSHSVWSGFRSGASWSPSSSKRVLPSQCRTERPRLQWRPFRRDFAVTRTRRWVYKNPTTFLGCLVRSGCGPAVAQRFVHFSAHPQPVQQHRQLPRHRHDRPLLGILAAALVQLQSPALQIRIRATPVQN